MYHIIASGPLPETLTEFTGSLNNKGVTLNWQTAIEENIKRFEIEYSLNGTSFIYLSTLSAHNAAAGSEYKFLHNIIYDGAIFYRLKIINPDGSFKYSSVIRVLLNSKLKNIITASLIVDGVININLINVTYNLLEVFTMNGKLVIKENIAGRTGQIKIPVSKLAKGIYAVRLIGNSNSAVEKIVVQ